MAAIRQYVTVGVGQLTAAQVDGMQTAFETGNYPGLTATFSGGQSGSFPNFTGGSGEAWTVVLNQASVSGTDAQGIQNILNTVGLALNAPN